MPGGLSLESMMAIVQASAAQRAHQRQQAQAAQESQQTQQARQAQQSQQQPQQGVSGAPHAGCDLHQAQAHNEVAGQQWGEFKGEDGQTQTDVPVEPAGAASTAREFLYSEAAESASMDTSGDTPATPAATTLAADTPAAATTTAAETPAAPSALDMLRQQQPNLRTNQDLINYGYKQGGGTWEGASKTARDLGTNLNTLIRDRAGTIGSATRPGTRSSTTAPQSPTSPSTPDATGSQTRAQGVDRNLKGFREVDVNALRDQLPPQARQLAQSFVDAGRTHNVDPIALAAISRHETGNFTSSAFHNKNNAMGVSNRSGPIQQASHEASIDKMARLLGSTTSGPYKNARTVGEIGKIYAPIGAENDPRGLNNHWAQGVARFADDFEKKVGAPSSPSSPLSTAQSSNTQSSTSGSPQASGQSTATGTGAQTTSGQDGTARIERTTSAGQRHQMVEGSVTVNGNTYKFRSGGHGRGSLPPGQYNITRHLDSRSDRSMSVGGVGYSFAMSDKFDSRIGDTRTLLRVHPDGGSAGTEGCLGIVGDAATQRRFRDDMLAEIRRHGGSYTLNVQ